MATPFHLARFTNFPPGNRTAPFGHDCGVRAAMDSLTAVCGMQGSTRTRAKD